MSLICLPLRAQDVAIKTNGLYWATTTPNLGVEFRLSRRFTLELPVGYNPFTFSDNRKIKHVAVEPELRYWLCESFGGHFFGVQALYSHFNAGGIKLPFGIFPSLKDSRMQGDAYGAGLTYGYNFMLDRHWGLELELGLGVIHTRYKEYECRTCGSYRGTRSRTLFMPTEAAINIVYNFNK